MVTVPAVTTVSVSEMIAMFQKYLKSRMYRCDDLFGKSVCFPSALVSVLYSTSIDLQ